MKKTAYLLLFFWLWAAMAAQAAIVKETQLVWCALPSEYLRLLSRIVENYNQTQKNVVFVVENFENEAVLQKALLKGGKTPNLAVVPSYWLADLLKTQQLVSIEDEMEKISPTVRIMSKMDTFKSLVEGCSFNKSMWLFPVYGAPWVAFYDDNMLSLAGFSKPPAYLTELISLGEKLLAKPAAPPLFYLPGNAYALGNLFRIFLWQSGQDIFDYGTGVSNVAGKDGEYLLKLWQTWLKKGVIKLGYGEAVLSFGTQDELIELEASGKRITAARLPISKGKVTGAVSPVECYALAMFKKNAKSEAKAYHLAYYIREFPQNLKLALENPYLPAHKQVLRAPEYFQYLQMHPGLRVMEIALEKGKVDPILSNYQKFLTIIGEEIKPALTGKMEAKTALENAKNRIEQAGH